MQTDILVRFGSILPILRKLVFSWKIGPYNFVVLSSPNVLEKTEKKKKNNNEPYQRYYPIAGGHTLLVISGLLSKFSEIIIFLKNLNVTC